MDEDIVSFGGPWSSSEPASLRDVFDASYRRLVVQLFGVTLYGLARYNAGETRIVRCKL